MTGIKLELRGGESIGSVHITREGELRVMTQNPLLRPRLVREIQTLITQSPLMERFGRTERTPEGGERHITKGRICSPSERAYLEALAVRIRHNKIQLGDARLLAWVVDELAQT